MPSIMKTFHSSGTPIGRLVRMCRWNRSITTAATLVTGPPSPSRSRSGTPNSTTVPACARVAESREGRRSSGKSRWNRRLIRFDRQIGLLLSMAATTNGKCRLSLEVAAPHQIATMTSIAAMRASDRR